MLDTNTPDGYLFARSLFDGGASYENYQRGLLEIDKFFDKEFVYENAIYKGRIVRKQKDIILILKADKLRKAGAQLSEEYDDLNERASLNDVKEIMSQMAPMGIDLAHELLSKFLERHIENKKNNKQLKLNL